MPLDFTPSVLKDLRDSVDHSRRKLAPFREERQEFIKEYVGSHYSDDGPSLKQIVNFMNLTADVYTMSLAANRPRVLVTTHHRQLRPFAKQFQVAVNNLLEEIKLEETIRAWVLDAFFSVGIIKVFQADTVPMQVGDDLWADPGQPYAEVVSLDDWVHDVRATRWSKIRYCGDYFDMPLETLMSDDRFDPDVVKRIQPGSTRQNDGDGEEPVRNLTRGSEGDSDEYQKTVRLLQLWLPEQQQIVTFVADKNEINGEDRPLMVMDWDGPEDGPYHILTFSEVPDNIMPVAPAMNLHEMSKLLNSLMRKQSRQARNQKTVTIYHPSAEDDAKKINRASDGDMIPVQDKDAIDALTFNGVDPQTQAFFLGAQDIYSKLAGNLDAMAGLGPQSETLGQDELIHSAVSKREAKMQYRVVDGVTKVVSTLGWMLWVDQVKRVPGDLPLEGTDISVPIEWTPEEREGDFFQYNFSVEPYSMQYQSPSQRVSSLMNLLQQLYLPALPMLAQQGAGLDWWKLTQMFAEYLDMPELTDIVLFQNPVGPDVGPQTRQSPVTTRNQVRRNVPTGGTESSRRSTMAQSLMDSGQVNDDQRAAMRRPA